MLDRSLRLVPVGYGHPDAVTLIDRVQGEYVERYGSPDESPVDPMLFDPPQGLFVVGYEGGVPVATGAWRRSEVEAFGLARTAEIKRMYVVPEARGRGLARAMLAHLEQTAYATGFEALVLETGTKQPEAIALYASEGYEPIAGFGHYQGSPLSRCYAKVLKDRCPDRP